MDVSIIVPVYNAEQYLCQCLESLLNQETNYLYEIICVNDGSTDDSLKILNNYKDKIIIIDKKNEGPGIARNKGIEIAKGKYLMFADSDDYVATSFVEKLVYNLEKNEADVCICDFYRVKDGNKFYVDKGKNEVFNEGKFQVPLLMEYHSVNKIFKKELFCMYPKNMFFEDVVAIGLSLINAKKIVKIHDALYYYRQISDSTTNTLSEKAYDIFEATIMLEKNYIEKGYQDVIEFLFANNILVDLCIKIVKSKKDNAKKEVMYYLEYVNQKYPNWNKNQYLHESKFTKRLYLFFLRKHFYGIIHLIYGMR